MSESPPGAPAVMVADDNVDAADTLGVILELAGYSVHVAYNGTAAIELAGQVRPLFAVLDLNMPGASGFEVACWIRQQPWGGQSKLLALTANGTADYFARSQHAGFNVHLLKPTCPSEVIRALQAACD